MFKLKAGWTKEKMKRYIRRGNDGTRAFSPQQSMCVYLTDDGNKCAVGCFIPKANFEQGMNVAGDVFDLLDTFNVTKFMPLTRKGMKSLQVVHDNVLGLVNMRKYLCNWIDKNVTE